MSNSFLPKSARRQVKLRTATVLFSATEEKRMKLSLSMPLTGESLIGLPDWLATAHDAVATELESATADRSFEGMNLDVYATDQTDKRQLQLTGCQLHKFSVERCGDKENPDIVLRFPCLAPFNSAAWKWIGEIVGHDFFAKFDAAQMELEAAS